jgi:hypothetical protein
MPRLAVALALLLASCANPTAETIAWRRAGTSAEEAGQDLHSCKRASQSQVDREQTDQSFFDQYGQAGLATSIGAYAQEKRVDELTQRCMKLRGYQPATKASG